MSTISQNISEFFYCANEKEQNTSLFLWIFPKYKKESLLSAEISHYTFTQASSEKYSLSLYGSKLPFS